jgi:hypothetical protein
MTRVEANGVVLGVESFCDAAGPLVLLVGGHDQALLARRARLAAASRRVFVVRAKGAERRARVIGLEETDHR